jgi:inner membrane protein involved in colicin E2 resistance
MRFPVMSKVAAVGAVLLGLLWGLSEVSNLVAERSARLHEAERSVADSLAGSQTITGPALTRVCTESWTSVQGEGKDIKRVAEQSTLTAQSLPRKLNIDGTAAIEPRYRGIYKVNGYLMSAKLTADWVDLAELQPKALHTGGVVTCAPATLMFALNDTRGVLCWKCRARPSPLSRAPCKPAMRAACTPHCQKRCCKARCAARCRWKSRCAWTWLGRKAWRSRPWAKTTASSSNRIGRTRHSVAASCPARAT